ncbi:MAG: hypothetical protein AB7J28_06570 [Hyphomonadaceae bacterium]
MALAPIAGLLVLVFIPALHAFLHKRPRRTLLYAAMGAAVVGVSVSSRVIWEARNPNGDWETSAPAIWYYGLSWPVLLVAFGAIVVVINTLMSPPRIDD